MSTTGMNTQPNSFGTDIASIAPGPNGGPVTFKRANPWIIRALVVAVVGTCVGVMVSEVSSEAVGLGAIGLLLALMFLKVPVAVSLSLAGLLGLYGLNGQLAATNALSAIAYDTVASWTLSVLPMFIFMGLLLWKSGIASKLYNAAEHWLGWLPGGLAIGTTISGAGLASVSGSTAGMTYALARIGIPEMLRAGYHRRLAVGAIIVAGLPGHLIPPSILLVVYAGIAQVAVGPQLIAGVGPGVIVALCASLMILALALFRPSLVGRGNSGLPNGTGGARAHQHESLSERRSKKYRSALAVWPVPVLILTVLGSMFSGVFTATEAGAAGAFGALLLTLWYKRGDQPLTAIGSAALETARTAGTLFFLIIGAHIFARLLAVSGLASGFSVWIGELGLGRVGFVLIVMLGYLIMGMFLEPMPMMLLTVPLLLPTLEALDISLLWFGVFAVFMGELATITPPVGIISYLIHGIAKDPEVNQGQEITLGDVFRSVGLLIPIVLIFLGILIAFPDIATFLPDLME